MLRASPRAPRRHERLTSLDRSNRLLDGRLIWVRQTGTRTRPEFPDSHHRKIDRAFQLGSALPCSVKVQCCNHATVSVPVSDPRGLRTFKAANCILKLPCEGIGSIRFNLSYLCCVFSYVGALGLDAPRNKKI